MLTCPTSYLAEGTNVAGLDQESVQISDGSGGFDMRPMCNALPWGNCIFTQLRSNYNSSLVILNLDMFLVYE